MDRLGKYSLEITLTILLCIQGINTTAQTGPSTADCADETRTVYADSLDRLLLAHQTAKVVQISDSLIKIHGDLICPDLIRIKAANANAYELRYNFENALETYNEILKTAEANQYTYERAAIRLSMARVYETIDRPQLCKEYLEEARVIIDANNMNGLLSRYYVRHASYQRIYEDRALAREYSSKAIILGKAYNNKRSVADGNLVLGIVTDDFEESIGYLKEAARLFFQLGDVLGAVSQEMSVGRRYLKRGAYDEVKKIITSVTPHIEGVTDNERQYYQLKSSLEQLKAGYYEAEGQKDSVILSLKQRNQYERLFGFLVNQEKINQLALEDSIQQEKDKVALVENRNWWLYVGLAGLSVFTLMLLRLFMLNRAKNKKINEQTSTITQQFTELEKLYNYQSTLLSEVHHRIKNNLQLIISLLVLQKSKLGNEVEASVLDMLSHRITSISLIHEQLYNLKEFDHVDVNLYAQDLLKNFQTLTAGRNVVIDHKADQINLNLETIIPLGLIWSELISNSLKYNKHKDSLNIYFELIKSNDEYTMHYYDNGVGYPDGQFDSNKTGMGYTIIFSLSKQLFAKTKSYNSGGAHFEMTFKEKDISPL